MTDNPYSALPASAYWRSAVAERAAIPDPSWCTPKWQITREDRIATAGSCFAQHIGRHLRASGYRVIDAEPAPMLLPAARHMDHSYGIYSARYGNIYTARQMRQLAEEAFGRSPVSREAWARDGRYVDALRPTIDPEGHATPEAVHAHRDHHLKRVREVLLDADILVFTLGLTETWEDLETGRALPVCPGTVAGTFDQRRHAFRNLTFREIWDDMVALRSLLHEQRGNRRVRMLLTVSPVPLTATAAGRHVMQATTYSKAVLRAVAGQLTDEFEDIDYFPSFEIVANPWTATTRYARNMRSVLDSSVEMVMRTFMAVHSGTETMPAADRPAKAEGAAAPGADADDLRMTVKCDEELLDAFGPAST